jgi:hypothetical protein
MGPVAMASQSVPRPGAEPAAHPQPPLRLLLLLLAFLPALAAAVLVERHAVNVPVWDDWERAKLVAAWHEGRLDFGFLYAPHIDHRIVIPRLAILLNAWLSGGDVVWELWLGFAVVLGTALALHGLLRRSLGERPGSLYGVTFLANLVLFSPLQWENFLWAAQPWFLFPMGALCAVLLVLQSRLGTAAKLGLCLLLAVVATHTFSHGIPIWAAVFAFVLVARDFGSVRVRMLFLATWILAAALVLVPYFTIDDLRNATEASHGFGVSPGERAPGLSLEPALANPVKVGRFYLTMVGNVFSRTNLMYPRDLAPGFGVAINGLFAAAAALWLWRWREERLFARGLPWILLGGYAAGLCALAAEGRSAIVVWSYALLPHYVSIALYLLLAALVLWVLMFDDLRRRISPSRAALYAFLERAPAFGAGLLVVAIGLGWLVGIQGMGEWESARLQARTSLLFLNRFEPRYHRRYDGSAEVGRRMATLLDHYGYLDPPLARDAKLDRFAVGAPLPAEAGRIQQVTSTPSRVGVRGFAWLPEAGRRADGVLLTARDASGERVAIALGELRGLPVFIISEADHIYNEVQIPGPSERSAWMGRFREVDLPEGGSLDVEAFAVDSKRMRLHRLGGYLRVRHSPDGLRAELRSDEARDAQ